jgi:hypothetical protein
VKKKKRTKSKPKEDKNIWANLYEKIQQEGELLTLSANAQPIALTTKHTKAFIDMLFDVGTKK